jgi:hypothetical protein
MHPGKESDRGHKSQKKICISLEQMPAVVLTRSFETSIEQNQKTVHRLIIRNAAGRKACAWKWRELNNFHQFGLAI